MAVDGRAVRWILIVLTFVSTSVGCTRVAAYERGKLSHPTMSSKDLAGPVEAHVRAIHEGAVGGAFEAGGGCGCN